MPLPESRKDCQSSLDECGNSLPGGYERIPIPDNRSWIVTMWHFGRDRKFQYKNNAYSLTWGYGREVLRIYTKSIHGIQVERIERQEYPNKPLIDALKEGRNGSGIASVGVDGHGYLRATPNLKKMRK